jgi:hypothetical protein
MKRSCIAGSRGRSIMPLFNLGMVVLTAYTLITMHVSPRNAKPVIK